MFAPLSLILWSLLAGQAAPAVPPLPLPPRQKWVVDAEDNLCLGSRAFGDGDAQIFFAIEPQPTTPNLRLIIIGHRSTGNAYGDHGGTVTLRPSGAMIKGPLFSYPSAVKGIWVTQVEIDRAALANPDAIGAIEIRAGNKLAGAVAPIHLGAMLSALRTCENGLLKLWGVDPAQLARIVKFPEPVGSPARWFGPDDYPLNAMRAGQQGRAVARISIAADGTVTDCGIVASSGSRDLDNQTCMLARRRGRFRPAHDKDGVGIAALYILPVRWMLPFG